MPAWVRSKGGPLTEKQVTALVDGIETHWAKPVNAHSAPLPPYSEANEKGDGGRGKKLFVRDCFMCHGPGAPIGLVTDPNYLELSSDQNLRTSIIVGRPDFGMPDYRNLSLGRALANQDITDLVAYMSSLRPVTENVEALPTKESGPGQGEITKGNEGSGYGPGSPRQQSHEGVNAKGSSSQRGVK